MLVLDANVVLEILEKRYFYNDVIGALEKYARQDIESYLSTLTISNVFYLAERHKIPTKRVEMLLGSYKVFDVVASDVAWALEHYGGKDFEDAVQVAAAVRAKCSVFLTLDAPLAKKYSKFLNIKLIA